jgi:hypothetical protein
MAEKTTEKQFDVFLSYNSKDRSAVVDLANKLRAQGLNVWLDVCELRPGHPWQEALEEIIKKCSAVAVLVGDSGIGPWENMEMRGCISEFVQRNLPVIPVLLSNCPQAPVLPFFLKGFTWVDYRDGQEDDGFHRLMWGITGEKPNEWEELPALRPKEGVTAAKSDKNTKTVNNQNIRQTIDLKLIFIRLFESKRVWSMGAAILLAGLLVFGWKPFSNDNITTATEKLIAEGIPVSGSIVQGQDQHFFKFTASSDKTRVILRKSSAIGFRAAVDVYDRVDNRVAGEVEGISLLSGLNTQNQPVTFSFESNPGEIYYIKVKDFTESNAPGNYQLMVQKE